MPEASVLVMLAIIVVSAILIFKVGKGVIQGLLLVSAVLSIVAAVAGGFVVKDALELKDNFQTSDNMLLLSDNDWAKLTAGMVVKGQAAGQAGQAAEGNVKALTVSELEMLNPKFAKKDYDALRGKNYKLIIIKESSVTGSLPDSIEAGVAAADEGTEGAAVGAGGKMKISSEDVLKQLKESGGEERAAMLAALLSLRVNQDPVFIISEYKKDNVIVYPETAVFKAIKLIPLSLFKGVAEKALQQAADVTKKVAAKTAAT